MRAWGKAVAWAERGLETTPLEPAAEGALRFFAGTALTYVGDLLRAELELTRFLQLAKEHGIYRELQGDARFNLAYLMRSLKRPAAELHQFTRAAEAYAAMGRWGRVLACRYEIAWCRLMAGEPALAARELDDLRQGLAEAGDAELSIDVQIATALYHQQMGHLDEARTICRELLALEQPTPARQLADIAWILAEAALQQGDMAAARQHTAEAYEAAVEDWWPPQMERIGSLRERLLARPGAGC